MKMSSDDKTYETIAISAGLFLLLASAAWLFLTVGKRVEDGLRSYMASPPASAVGIERPQPVDALPAIAPASQAAKPVAQDTRTGLRPRKAVLGHWKTVVGEPAMRFSKFDFNLYIAPHEKGLLLTEVWASGELKDAVYVVDSENLAEKSLTLTRLYRPNETNEKREKLDDSNSWLHIDARGRLVYSRMVYETPVMDSFSKATTPRVKQAYYTCSYIDSTQEP